MIKMKCDMCDGHGYIYYQALLGYVTYDMALDAEAPSIEGMPLYQDVQEPCPQCEGSGEIENE